MAVSRLSLKLASAWKHHLSTHKQTGSWGATIRKTNVHFAVPYGWGPGLHPLLASQGKSWLECSGCGDVPLQIFSMRKTSGPAKAAHI